MNSRNPSRIFSHLSLTPFPLLLILFRISSADDGNSLYNSCNATFSCGFIEGVGYPFRGYDALDNCGYPGLALKCQKNIPTIQFMNLTYRLMELNSANQTMQIAREDAMNAACPRDLVNTTLDNSLFEYSPGYVNLTFLYDCPASSIPKLSQVWGFCPSSGFEDVHWLTGTVGPFECQENITVPVSARSESINSNNLGEVMEQGVEVKWKVNGEACSQCRESKGRCGFDFTNNQTTCFCPHPPYVSATCAVVDAEAPSSESSPGPGSSSNRRTIVEDVTCH
ncbi:LEAF RUST 10 DISEASE-RESISTANCE LOCUS RECEPTOR-LIKE PROTEIN KINASE-like 2.7 isoform X2 [Diospyros lotus]|uniref:LEAF RUST 10 DISEASE-RESISTANCE LOCUS RECEPTOR-LIKE PROTEIN KINASE-like 2.7 isoform X2 n=1 Tax=Diospyros lotus TaxID=55363 RepID=UPI0022540073|nr:LEAF RUST 10 DISEASE-RESISTANCE LOCUS RECEPTOR-LIKE PROTEIN KINASE-like 2.7 isoform X2 [Diospyros lotus]